jgi:hypothetical protein
MIRFDRDALQAKKRRRVEGCRRQTGKAILVWRCWHGDERRGLESMTGIWSHFGLPRAPILSGRKPFWALIAGRRRSGFAEDSCAVGASPENSTPWELSGRGGGRQFTFQNGPRWRDAWRRKFIPRGLLPASRRPSAPRRNKKARMTLPCNPRKLYTVEWPLNRQELRTGSA